MAPPSTIPRLATRHPLGHLSDMRKDFLGLQLRAMREGGGVALLRLGATDAVMVTSPAYAQEVLVERAEDYEKSAAVTVMMRPVVGDGILSSQGSRHKRRRQIVAPAFQANRIARYVTDIVRETDKALARFQPGQRVDFGEEMLHLTLEIVGATLFNSRVTGDIEAVGRAVTEGSQAVTDMLRAPLFLPPLMKYTRPGRQLHRVGRELDRIVYRIIEDRQRSGDDPGDVLSMLLNARDSEGGKLSNEELRDEVMTLFLAGHETTANALTWALTMISANPEVARKLQAEADALGGRAPQFEDLARLPYALAVFKESLRLYPPAYLLGRLTLTETQIGGHWLPRGQLVFIGVYAIHMRPELYPEPTAFRPERFLDGGERRLPKSGFMPFGGGPRVCVGNHFALMEGQLVLARLAQRFELAGAVRGIPEAEPLVTLRPRQDVLMEVRPRDDGTLRAAGE